MHINHYYTVIDLDKLKYKVNYNQTLYNFKTKQYESKETTYINYKEARANQWRCEKCNETFATLKELKHHKIEAHSY